MRRSQHHALWILSNVLLLTVAVFAGGADVRCDEHGAGTASAQSFIEAIERNDPGAATRILLTSGAEPLAFGAELQRLLLIEGGRRTSTGPRIVTSLRALRTALPEHPDAEGLARAVRRLERHGPGDWKQELELAQALTRMQGMADEESWPLLRGLADTILSNSRSLTGSLVLVPVRALAAHAAFHTGDRADCARMQAETARQCRAMAWWTWATRYFRFASLDTSALQRTTESVTLARAAVVAADKLGPGRARVLARQRLANALSDADSHGDAVAAWRLAVRDARAFGETGLLHTIATRAANVLGWAGAPAEGLELARAALSAAQEQGIPRALAESHVCLGRLLAKNGRHAEAITHLEAGLDVPLPAAHQTVHAVAHVSLAWAWDLSSDAGRTRHHAQVGARVAEALDNKFWLASALIWWADAALSLGAPHESEKQARRALAVLEQGVSKLLTAQARTKLGNALRDQGRIREALDLYTEARVGFTELGARTSLAYLAGSIAEAQMSQGNYSAALRELEPWIRPRGHADGEKHWDAYVHELLARALHAMGRHRDALAAAERTIYARLELAAGFGTREASGSREITWQASQIAIRSASAAAHRSPEERSHMTALAFRLLESGRASVLDESVRSRRALLRARLPLRLWEDYQSSLKAVQLARKNLLLATARTPISEARLTAATEEFDQAWTHHQRLIERVERISRHLADVLRPAAPSLATHQGRLRPSDAWISYAMGAGRLHALVIRHNAAELIDLGPSEGLSATVEAWIDRLSTDGARDGALAYRLFRRLMMPLMSHLTGVTRIYVSPDDVLTRIPFAALATQSDGSRVVRLIERFEVLYAPSAAVFASLSEESSRAARGRGILALGGADYTKHTRLFAPLPHSRSEAQKIAEMFPEQERQVLTGDSATASRAIEVLEGNARDWRTVHLSCHSIIDDRHAERSALALSHGTQLDAARIQRIRMGAELVVLSACETATGELLRGEGVLGLVRAFFMAGARRVVASFWCVPDKSTQEFMEAFYQRFLANGDAVSTALRRAQIACIQRGDAFAHPYHWAAFGLFGLP